MSKINVASVPFLVINRFTETGYGNAGPAFKTAAATVNLGGGVILDFRFWIQDRDRSFHFSVCNLSVIPLVLPRRWLGTGSFRFVTPARRTPAGLLRRTNNRSAQRTGSQMTTMHII
ncbi:MAG TPA: hypothetical protein VNH11_08475 [Pirellulales bacterium]|nr:hypothetical protein [Pirellulales bacterium]